MAVEGVKRRFYNVKVFHPNGKVTEFANMNVGEHSQRLAIWTDDYASIYWPRSTDYVEAILSHEE